MRNIINKENILKGVRRKLNFIEGSNVSIIIEDNPSEKQVDITIEASGGTGGYDGDPTIIIQDDNHRFVTDTEKSTWDSKADSIHEHLITDVFDLQASLDNKQDILISETNIKSINGESVLGSGDLTVSGGGYTLSVQALTSSPADGATIYFGQLPKAPVTTANISKVYFPKNGTIKRAYIYCYSGTAGTNQNWSCYIRLNNTTDTLVETIGANTNERIFNNESLSISVTTSDYFEIKMVNPTWPTNPATTIFGGYIYIE
jgi:hypothetical protein